MRKILLLSCLLISIVASAQKRREDAPITPEPTTLNKVDSKGKRHGLWLSTTAARMGEVGFSEFGNYDHGIKIGQWYKIDEGGELMAIEAYRNNVRDGEVRYYEQGKLYCVGHYRGLNPRQQFDTIVVMDPTTQEEQYRIIPTEQGSLRHGLWRYYDPNWGFLTKEEEYQVDELVYKKDFIVSSSRDSLNKQKHEEQLPHVKRKPLSAPRSGRISYSIER
ncbi:MAG: hypothetical protein JSS78_07835 [Bacteroidetes bacterium]|nr:hypothetical protein [Bacteroidota bacterium]